MRKLVSFCLYGTAPRYLNGALENAKLMKAIYPDWQMRVYSEEGIDAKYLEDYDVEVVKMGKNNGHMAMFWRMLPIWDDDVDRVIFRDCDSRINMREATAVQEWEQSSYVAHAMHDHPHHQNHLIFGGMWGIMGKSLPHALMLTLKDIYYNHGRKGQDTRALSRYVFPYIATKLMTHTSVPVRGLSIPPKPFTGNLKGFIGQQYDDEGNQVWP
mgnify:CR=1 FL=1